MKKRVLKGAAAMLTLGLTAVSLTSCVKSIVVDPATPEKEGYKILWSDEFNGTSLDDRLWNRELREAGWTNNELQEYVADEANGFVRDGKFVLKGIEYSAGKYTSCKLNTHHKADFTYGYIECSAKVPEGKGLWPAIWMMPEEEDVYGQWPKCGEIDIMEVLGDAVDTAYGTVHYGEPHAEQQSSVKLTGGNTFASEFHTYAVDWEPDKITWYIDGVKYHEATDWFTAVDGEDEKAYPAPFNQKFGIQINLAIGGDWPGNPAPNADYMANAEFEIDYVRVYQKNHYKKNVKAPVKEYRDADKTGNYVVNGTFENEDLTDEVNWQFKGSLEGGEGTAKIENNQITIETTKKGTADYSIQLIQHGVPIYKDKKYKLTFTAWAAEERSINEVCIDAPNAGWKRYWSKRYLKLGTTPQEYSFEFTPDERYIRKDDNATRLEFNMGASAGSGTASTATVYIKDVKLVEIA